jgi:hypothetical protein
VKITVDIPDETAARMLGEDHDAAHALLELAGYTACENGRISEYEYSQMLGLDDRFDVHEVMKRIRLEGEAMHAEFLQADLATLAEMDEMHKVSKLG